VPRLDRAVPAVPDREIAQPDMHNQVRSVKLDQVEHVERFAAGRIPLAQRIDRDRSSLIGHDAALPGFPERKGVTCRQTLKHIQRLARARRTQAVGQHDNASFGVDRIAHSDIGSELVAFGMNGLEERFEMTIDVRIAPVA